MYVIRNGVQRLKNKKPFTLGMKILIVGAGLSGCTLARQLAEHNHHIHIIEKREHLAGNCYDEINHQGILMNRYGAHLFHTSSEQVWEFVNRFSEWVPWHHEVVGKIGDDLFPIPVNRTTVNTLCNENLQTDEDMKEWLSHQSIPCESPKNSEEVALKRVGPILYDKIFKHYTFKQWAKYPAELDASVMERLPFRINDDKGYFTDLHQALPKEGYTTFVERMIDHPHITVSLETEYSAVLALEYDVVFYTGPIDHYFEWAGLPKLEYRSIVFEAEDLDQDYFQSNSVVNYPSPIEPYTRIVEYKHFLNQNVPGKTTIVKEYTVAEGDPYYPVPNQQNRELYEQYRKLAEMEEKKGIYFVGRLANYKYYNMDAAIENALKVAEKFITQNE
jgi:UDP-galactopyranose mutase